MIFLLTTQWVRELLEIERFRSRRAVRVRADLLTLGCEPHKLLTMVSLILQFLTVSYPSATVICTVYKRTKICIVFSSSKRVPSDLNEGVGRRLVF